MFSLVPAYYVMEWQFRHGEVDLGASCLALSGQVKVSRVMAVELGQIVLCQGSECSVLAVMAFWGRFC